MGRTVVHRIVRVGGGADLAVARNLPRVELLVLAKAPVAGRAKTRLCPPLTPAQAAEVAEAALADTLEVAVGSGADRVLLVLDGEPGPWCPVGLEIVGQVGGPLGVRLESAWSHARGPALQIGMDTPQISVELLEDVGAALLDPDDPVDALLGPAADGGWWLLGQRQHRPGVFEGVPMSTPSTAARQFAAIQATGRRVRWTAELRDVDHVEDLEPVAAVAPGGRFAAVVASLASARV